MKIPIKKLDTRATLPHYSIEGDAGMDLHALDRTEVPIGKRVLVPTGIAMAIPKGYTGLVWDKGGVAANRGVTVLGGVFDTGYSGDLTIILFNTSDTVQVFEAGEKIAQILIQTVEQPELIEVDEFEKSERGEGRFGSTGTT